MKKLTASTGAKSKLDKPIQDLIRMIFDVESMKKAMVEFEVCSLPPLFILFFKEDSKIAIKLSIFVVVVYVMITCVISLTDRLAEDAFRKTE